ncbi:MAG: SLBB domain-containing protein [Bacteroidetes bacterium]|nr:SLBB domain-containing protein [Bacteroidota bacterium]
MKKILFLVFLFLAANISLSAQTLMTQDLRDIKVDQLSDADILYYYNKMQAANVTMDQAAQIAASKGMPADEIAKLQQRVNKLLATQNGATLYRAPLTNDTMARSQNKVTLLTQENKIDKRIFGSDLFTNSSMGFEPNLRIATPLNYLLGPDDELNVDIYGVSETHYKLKITPEGSVYIPNVGPVYVAGLTVDQASSKITNKLSSTIYKAIISGSTKVQVSLGNIRSIQVTIIGEAKQPGTYTVSSLATVFNALYLCGGPSRNGSYRKIELIRNNQVFQVIDLYDFLLKGSMEDNVRLMDQDVIRIPYYESRVVIGGQVKREGIFEIKPSDNLQDLLNAAGGFTDSAYRSSVKITRLTDKEMAAVDVSRDNYSNYILKGGDSISVNKILDRYANRVQIAGAVMRPGQFELSQNLTLSELIQKADGLKEDAFLSRGIIRRLKPDLTLEMLSFDVNGIVNKTQPDILLQREDSVVISSLFDMRDVYTISLQGQIRNPGIYLFKDSMSLKDAIFEAGGFTESTNGKRIEVARRVTNADPNSTEIAKTFEIDANKDLDFQGNSFYLKPYDVVIIRNNPGYFVQKSVTVSGEVLYPGVYVINSNDEKLSDVVKRAGGLKYSADPIATSLKRMNKIDTLTALKTRNVEKLALLGLSDTTLTDSIHQEVLKPYDLIGINMEEVLQNPGISNDLILEDGDVIFVPKKNQAVKVRGEVLFPTQFAFQEGKNMKFYINKAGGFSGNAVRRRAFVLAANGNARVVKHFLFFKSFPKINAGDEIFVPGADKSRGRLSTGEVVGLTTAIVSLASVVILVINNLK